MFHTSRFFIAILIFSSTVSTGLSFAQRPNILWIYAEDTSPWMGCYGDDVNIDATPNIDAIAEAGVRFNRAYVPAPVCSATRSAMIIGQSAIRFGAHQHRSSRTPKTRIQLPQNYKLLPELLSEQGYTTFNFGKADYNFAWNEGKTYNHKLKKRTDFSGLVNKQPFFGQIQLRGGKNNTENINKEIKVDPNSVAVPADYPNNKIFKEVVAQHYEAIRLDDNIIGKIIQQLKDTGLYKNTIIVYFSDHGANNLLRHKQMLTEGGLHVPFVVMGPNKYVPNGKVRNDLVNMLDLSATTLSWADVEIPNWYEGQNLFSENSTPRSFVAAHKDRLDHTIDRVRTVRTENYRYVRNYKLDRIFLQPQYRDSKNFTKNLHHLYNSGRLSKVHKEIYFGERPAEELYNVRKDPAMIYNLVGNPTFRLELERHRELLDEWLAVGDMGSEAEPIANLMANGDGKKWGQGVNPEYEKYRVDSDGDGLSNRWEIANNRDPQDGLLYFEFDCGGWQTEGWRSTDISSNLAGSLGYLDFKLDNKKGTIYKERLQIRETNQQKNIAIKMKSTADLKIFVANDHGDLGNAKYSANPSFQEVLIPLNINTSLSGTTKLEISFRGKKNDLVEIDYIKQK
jgi:N-sulfoglucosamine sulfohydrolase